MERTTIDPSGRIRFDDINGVHEWGSPAELATDYWRCRRLTGRARGRDRDAAGQCVADLVEDPVWEGCVELIDVLLQQSCDEQEVYDLAAGPLEDLVRQPMAPGHFVGDIVHRAQHDIRWSTAVSGIWLDRDGSPEVNRMLARIGARYADGESPLGDA